jgi:hypothetical protein
MVVLTGLMQNMNNIVLGTDDTGPLGLYLGLVGLGVIVALNALANGMSWWYPRTIQHIARAIVTPVMEFLLNRAAPAAQFRREDISPYFCPNGKGRTATTRTMSISASWRTSDALGQGDIVLCGHFLGKTR